MTFQSSLKKRILPGMLAVAAVSILAVSGRYAYGVYRAELLANNVRATIESWDPREGVSTQESWDEAHGKITQALAFAPNVPEYHRLEGMLYEWYAFSAYNLTESGAPIMSSYIGATESYSKSVNFIPSEAIAWTRLARVQARSLRWDENLKHSFRMAMKQGGDVVQVQSDLAQVSTMIWNYLNSDPELRIEVLDYFANSLEAGRNTGRLLQYLNFVPITPLVCERLVLERTSKQIQTVCQESDV